MNAPIARRIVCFGDSITHGAEFEPAQRWTTLLQQKLDACQPCAWQVYNHGVGGNTTAQGFDRFGADVMLLLPAVVLVQFGFNDANVYNWTTMPRIGLTEYTGNLREFHRLITGRGGECVFIVNHTIAAIDGCQGNDLRYSDNFAPYETALRDLVSELDASSIDLAAMMRETDVDLHRLLAEDGLHLSVEGNVFYADMVFDALTQQLSHTLQRAL